MNRDFCVKCAAFSGTIYVDYSDLMTYCVKHKTDEAIPYSGDAATLDEMIKKNHSPYIAKEFKRKRDRVSSVRFSQPEMLYLLKQMELFNIKTESGMIKHMLQAQPSPRELTEAEKETITLKHPKYLELYFLNEHLEKQIEELEQLAIKYAKSDEIKEHVRPETLVTYCHKCGRQEKRNGYCPQCLMDDAIMIVI